MSGGQKIPFYVPTVLMLFPLKYCTQCNNVIWAVYLSINPKATTHKREKKRCASHIDSRFVVKPSSLDEIVTVEVKGETTSTQKIKIKISSKLYIFFMR
jgi:hypothetical protein